MVGRDAQVDEPADPSIADAVLLPTVEVVGRRGSARIAPERELDGQQIDALGAYDIGEAIGRASLALGLDAAPVLIINGRRVTNPHDFLGFPPDALVRLEVLPPEAAAQYGGDPSQRILNLVLQQSFRSLDGQLVAARPTAGGRSVLSGDIRRGAIAGNDTSQFGARLTRESVLRASEREVSADLSSNPDTSLRPNVEALNANFAVNRALGGWTASISGVGRDEEERSVRTGLAGARVQTRRRTSTVTLNSGLSGQAKGWNLQAGLVSSGIQGRQKGIRSLETQLWSTTGTISADRQGFELPAGPITTSLSGRITQVSSSNASDSEVRQTQTEEIAEGRATLAAPLLRGAGARGWGDATLTLGLSTQRTGDNAGGDGSSVGLSWAPHRKLRLDLSLARASEAPSVQQRFDPAYTGAPRTVFDFRNGQSVELSPILGGNPELSSQTDDTATLAVAVGPFTGLQLMGRTTLKSNTSRNGVSAFPTPTPAVEAAFPERFTRTADGRLVGIDLRPINLERALSDSLTSNLTFALPTPVLSASQGPAGALQVSVHHTWQIRSTAALFAGITPSDRLAGDVGGLSRHNLAVQVDGRFGRWTLNGGARWRGGYRVRREEGRDDVGDLLISDMATVDLKLGYVFERLIASDPDQSGYGPPRRVPGTRLALEIDNLLDSRPSARLGDGRAAPGFGRDDQDPIGRTVRVTIHQRF